MAVKSGVSINKFIQSINNELELKQNKLTAGAYINITEDGVISAAYEPVSLYSLSFTESDFDSESETLTIPAETHKCGNTPTVRYIQEGNDSTGWENVVVDVFMNSVGDVTIKANPFNGRLLLDSQFSNAADISSLVNEIMTGDVNA